MEQLQLTTQKHSESWMKIFPRDIKTLAGSTKFVKQLTALAFSCVTYMRGIFPEYAYLPREIDDVKLKVLSGNYDCKDAYLMTKWIKSAFEALDNKYMRELVLEILSADNEPLEYYTVVYKYTDAGPSCSLATSAKSMEIDFDAVELEEATKKLITTLLTVTESLGKLPNKYVLQLRVNYYDEKTPSSYKPKFFNHADPCEFKKLNYMKHQEIGSIETPYLAFSLYSGSKLVSLDESQQSFFVDMENSNHCKDVVEESDIETVQHSSVKITSVTKNNDANTEKAKFDSDKTWNFDRSANSQEDILPAKKEIYVPSEQILAKCLCGHNYENDKESLQNSSDTFTCLYCNAIQHLICYKKIPSIRDLDVKCCYLCAKSDQSSPTECTDASLMKYKPRQAQHLALYRQVIYRFQNRKNINMKSFDELGIKYDLAKNMMTKLENELFIKPKKNSKNIFVLNKTRVKNFIKAYFQL